MRPGASCRSMQDFISRKNIENYRLMLCGATLDPAVRLEVERLLAEELAKQPPAERLKQPSGKD